MCAFRCGDYCRRAPSRTILPNDFYRQGNRPVDEAASRLRAIDSKPEELDEFDRRIVQLKIERAALIKETDEMSRERLARLKLNWALKKNYLPVGALVKTSY